MTSIHKKLNIKRFLITGMIGMLWICTYQSAMSQIRSSKPDDPNSNHAMAGAFFNGKTQQDTFVSAKDKLIDLHVRNERLVDALQKVVQKVGLDLSYSKEVMPTNKRVTVDLNNVTLNRTVYKLLEGTSLRYGISSNGNLVVFKKKEKKVTKRIRKVDDTITGQVTDASSGEALPGVNIVVKGTTRGTSTNNKGNYELSVPSLQDTLLFSFIGYQTKQVPINGRNEINVALQAQTVQGQEMVVVGYGTQRKENLTGAVGTASSDRLENRPITNVGEGLQGVVPNLNITMRNGDPTSSPDFNVRGYTSINGGSPLIVVDGVPVDNLNRIDPNDIESVSVLKDAASAAVYGARAAYGVILVKTKEGKPGKIHVSVNSQWSMAKPIFNEHPINDPYTYVQLMNVAGERTNGQPYFKESMVKGTKAYSQDPQNAPEWGVVDGELQFYGNNNYQSRLLTDFAPTNHQKINISGGSDKATYLLSAGALKKDGYLKYNNISFRRYNVLMKGSYKPVDWIDVSGELRFNSEHNDQPHFYNWDVNINSLARVSPIMPVQFPDLNSYLNSGDHDQYSQYIGMYFGGTNFFPYLKQGGRTTFANNDTWLTGRVKLTPMKGLEIRSDFTPHFFNRNYQDVASKVNILNGTDLTNMSITNGFSNPDWIQNQNNYNQYYVINAYAKYAFDLMEDHHIEATVGYNQEWGLNKWIEAQAYSLISPSVTDLHATTGTQQTNGSSSQLAIRGAFYRLNYNYKDRYLLEADGRYDGTSRFPSDSRFGFFPSFSAGWRISNEKFMSGTRDWLNNLKMRASYGTLGNQDIGGYYPYIATMGSGKAPYIMQGANRISYVSAPGLISPSLTWETAVSKDLGLDITVLNGRLDGSFDVYTRDTKDMLMRKQYPDLLGASPPQQNAANLQTKGWELSLSWQDNISSKLNYNVKLSLSDYSAKITKFDNPKGNIYDYYVGKKMGTIWGYKTVGIFQNQDAIDNAPDQSQIGSNWQPGDIQYADLNGDGKISPGSQTLDDHGDLQVIGNTTPRYHFGINLGVNYKNWGLSTFFQGIGKRDVWPSSGNWTWFFPFNSLYMNETALNTWSKDNRDAYFYAPTLGYNTKKNLQTQTRYLQNAAYIRLKNIRLSYNLPQDLLNNIGIEQLQLYVTGMNVWEYSPIRNPLDPESIPEVTANTNGAIEYPLQRTYSFGVQINL